MTAPDTSLAGRGRDAMVPERGLPFDVTRRRGPHLPTDPAALRRETVAAVFDAVDWGAAAAPEPEPETALDQPAGRYFSAFPWSGPAATAVSRPGSPTPEAR